MTRVPVDASRIEGSTVRVSGADARHLLKVLRARAGDALAAYCADGREWEAVIVSTGPTSLLLELGAARAARPDSPCSILLGQGVAKGDKLDRVVRAATELGVAEVMPVLTSRSEPSGKNREVRLQRIAEEACKQCGRARAPPVHAPATLAEFLAKAQGFAMKLVPWEGGGIGLRQALPAATKSVALLVGPEGGLAAEEVEQAKGQGFVAVSLGPRILRTETAGIVAVALVQMLSGDLT
jgi:16S rRNA (uracil1498-N3)-methyltransferase